MEELIVRSSPITCMALKSVLESANSTSRVREIFLSTALNWLQPEDGSIWGALVQGLFDCESVSRVVSKDYVVREAVGGDLMSMMAAIIEASSASAAAEDDVDDIDKYGMDAEATGEIEVMPMARYSNAPLNRSLTKMALNAWKGVATSMLENRECVGYVDIARLVTYKERVLGSATEYLTSDTAMIIQKMMAVSNLRVREQAMRISRSLDGEMFLSCVLSDGSRVYRPS